MNICRKSISAFCRYYEKVYINNHHCWSLHHYAIWPLENWSPYRFSVILLLHTVAHTINWAPHSPSKCFSLLTANFLWHCSANSIMCLAEYGRIWRVIDKRRVINDLTNGKGARATPANIHQHHHSDPFLSSSSTKSSSNLYFTTFNRVLWKTFSVLSVQVNLFLLSGTALLLVT